MQFGILELLLITIILAILDIGVMDLTSIHAILDIGVMELIMLVQLELIILVLTILFVILALQVNIRAAPEPQVVIAVDLKLQRQGLQIVLRLELEHIDRETLLFLVLEMNIRQVMEQLHVILVPQIMIAEVEMLSHHHAHLLNIMIVLIMFVSIYLLDIKKVEHIIFNVVLDIIAQDCLQVQYSA